ncbi:MAG: sulfatase-like hydrolase/transferase, partial [Candidatus Hydrogenedentes bacterium]|nr:sulfatase-like hydrolase/transferase [Candidatus Hydrogenedentota bacterium]
AGFRAGGALVENPTLEIDGAEKKCTGLTVDLLMDYGLQFIRQAKQPFVFSLHHRSPHAPWLPGAAEDTAPYEKTLEIPNPDFPDLDIARVDRMTREYLSSVSGVDRSMANVLALLEELSLADNTIVIFSSDNGYNIGHHGVVHKGNASWITKAASKTPGHHPTFSRSNMFDSSLRVPLAVRWPKHLQLGRVVRETVSNLDWFPTLLAMTGAVAPNGALIRGRNFLPLLRGEKVEWENSFYGQYSQHHYVENHLRMYRTPEWKLVRDFMNAGKDELYDLKNDPGETTNLLEKPEAQEMRARLNEVLLWKMKEINDPVSSA